MHDLYCMLIYIEFPRRHLVAAALLTCSININNNLNCFINDLSFQLNAFVFLLTYKIVLCLNVRLICRIPLFLFPLASSLSQLLCTARAGPKKPFAAEGDGESPCLRHHLPAGICLLSTDGQGRQGRRNTTVSLITWL